MESHAWGISDGAFLAALLIACAAHLAVVVLLRLLCAHSPRLERDPSVDVYELAALTDGSIGVLTTAAASLQQGGHITAATAGTIVALTPPGDGCAAIERELYDAIAAAQNLNAYNLPAQLTRGQAWTQIAGGLYAKGLMPAPWIAVALRWLNRWVWAYGVIAFARMIAVSFEVEGPLSSATAYALGAGGLLPAAVWIASGRRSMPVTRLGRAVLARHREHHRHLQGGEVAGDDLALAVALFGSEPLRNAQPALASAWGIISPDQAALQRVLL